ncbi:hypothetical protein CY35_01G131600 [Sphagnum magellanicum]|jgi:hypothetical protein|nr:hypothetical protein CY35_01G131600 [Sphagnum magellanicum]
MVASAGMRRSSSSSMKRRPGSLLTVALLLLLVALLGQLQAVAATKYILNWNYPNYQNYFSNWNRGNNYVVGDSIEFVYNAEAHDVVKVSYPEYSECSTSQLPDTSGTTVFPLGQTGMHYFICTIPGHCAAGMKLAINVL